MSYFDEQTIERVRAYLDTNEAVLNKGNYKVDFEPYKAFLEELEAMDTEDEFKSFVQERKNRRNNIELFLNLVTNVLDPHHQEIIRTTPLRPVRQKREIETLNQEWKSEFAPDVVLDEKITKGLRALGYNSDDTPQEIEESLAYTIKLMMEAVGHDQKVALEDIVRAIDLYPQLPSHLIDADIQFEAEQCQSQAQSGNLQEAQEDLEIIKNKIGLKPEDQLSRELEKDHIQALPLAISIHKALEQKQPKALSTTSRNLALGLFALAALAATVTGVALTGGLAVLGVPLVTGVTGTTLTGIASGVCGALSLFLSKRHSSLKQTHQAQTKEHQALWKQVQDTKDIVKPRVELIENIKLRDHRLEQALAAPSKEPDKVVKSVTFEGHEAPAPVQHHSRQDRESL